MDGGRVSAACGWIRGKVSGVIAPRRARERGDGSLETRGGKNSSASQSQSLLGSQPPAPRLPTRRAQVCVVCHLHREGAGGWYTPAEKLDLNTQDEETECSQRGGGGGDLSV